MPVPRRNVPEGQGRYSDCWEKRIAQEARDAAEEIERIEEDWEITPGQEDNPGEPPPASAAAPWKAPDPPTSTESPARAPEPLGEAEKPSQGRRSCNRGEANNSAKLTYAIVRKIRIAAAEDVPQAFLARLYGVSRMTINRIVRGTAWRTD